MRRGRLEKRCVGYVGNIGKDVGHRREGNMTRLAVSCAETVKSWGGVADAVDR
jgi:hypothetical protein